MVCCVVGRGDSVKGKILGVQTLWSHPSCTQSWVSKPYGLSPPVHNPRCPNPMVSPLLYTILGVQTLWSHPSCPQSSVSKPYGLTPPVHNPRCPNPMVSPLLYTILGVQTLWSHPSCPHWSHPSCTQSSVSKPYGLTPPVHTLTPPPPTLLRHNIVNTDT